MSRNVSTICEICKKNVHKYKCPSCRLKYCSVPCYKEHKEAGCQKKEVTPRKLSALDTWMAAPKSPPADLEDGELSDDSEMTEDTVSKALLKELGHNPEVLAQLENPHLQNILLEVDSSRTVGSMIHTAMLEPLFSEFADTCLKVVEPDRCDDELKILQNQRY